MPFCTLSQVKGMIINMKRLIKVLIVIIVFISIVTAAGFLFIQSRPLPAINVGTVNLKDIRDGSFIGNYEAGVVKAVVRVDVQGNKITAVKIEKHECGYGKKAEVITKEIEKS
jgi:uncharacterized protein with FMN-binding domain